MTWVQMQEYCTTIRRRLDADSRDPQANEMLNSMAFALICAQFGQDSTTVRDQFLSRARSVATCVAAQ
ncbi:MAG: hypothetical protein FJ279_21520 [Planctomycetes bacterium]|nr:hypothetical protein [Planctomycetota bacterium]MBM4086306.1 hypothetical protein [Planctomycetota bacterium]